MRTTAAILVATIVAFAGPAGAPTDAVSLAVKDRSNSTPWVAAEGSFAAVAWGATLAGKTDVFVAVSRDAGRTFGPPVRVNAVVGEARLGGELAPRVALTSKGRSTTPEIAVLWTARGAATEIKTARSRDGGKTFGPPVTLQSPGAPGDRGWPALALDQQGTAHAIWLDHRGLAADRSGAPMDHAAHQAAAPRDGVAMARKSGLFYAAATGSRPVEQEITNSVCYCCKTALAVGRDGALYAAWRHVFPGSLRDIAFTVSRDGGRSFASPVRANEDGWAIDGCPDDGPALAVDGGGTVHMVWPTVVNGRTTEGALFYASTRDGRTFTRATRIPTLGSPKPWHPQIAVDRGGRIMMAWDEVVSGQRVASVREIRLQPDRRVEFGAAASLSASGPAMYPVLAPTSAGMLAVWTTGGDASVIQARLVPFP